MLIKVKVKPGAKKCGVAETNSGILEVAVDAPARDGRANERLIEILADHFGAAKSCVIIKKGNSSRFKTIEILR
jgi:uncharacterized protein